MRKKSGFTFVEQAIVLVPEFEMVVHKLEQQLRYEGRVGVLCKTTSAELPFLSFILVSCPRRLIPKRSMNTWPHWRVIPDLPREAVLNIWCTDCAIIIACWE